MAVAVTVKEAGVNGPSGTGCGLGCGFGGGVVPLSEEPHADKSEAATNATLPCRISRRVTPCARKSEMSRRLAMPSDTQPAESTEVAFPAIRTRARVFLALHCKVLFIESRHAPTLPLRLAQPRPNVFRTYQANHQEPLQ